MPGFTRDHDPASEPIALVGEDSRCLPDDIEGIDPNARDDVPDDSSMGGSPASSFSASGTDAGPLDRPIPELPPLATIESSVMPNSPSPLQSLTNAKLHKVTRDIPRASVYQQFAIRFARDVDQRVAGLENLIDVDKATAAQSTEQIRVLQQEYRAHVCDLKKFTNAFKSTFDKLSADLHRAFYRLDQQGAVLTERLTQHDSQIHSLESQLG